MSKSKSKKSPDKKKKAQKEKAPAKPKGWAVGSRVVFVENESLCGKITDPEVSAEEFWKSAPESTVSLMSRFTYVRFTRDDGASFGIRKDLLKLIDE
jgi:hypothetical protein|tara:strand:- start:363 stop:653 length:291 start_codon:yes stop_codon:yes gene_type:complete